MKPKPRGPASIAGWVYRYHWKREGYNEPICSKRNALDWYYAETKEAVTCKWCLARIAGYKIGMRGKIEKELK